MIPYGHSLAPFLEDSIKISLILSWTCSWLLDSNLSFSISICSWYAYRAFSRSIMALSTCSNVVDSFWSAPMLVNLTGSKLWEIVYSRMALHTCWLTSSKVLISLGSSSGWLTFEKAEKEPLNYWEMISSRPEFVHSELVWEDLKLWKFFSILELILLHWSSWL